MAGSSILARSLAIALGRRGYRNIQVGGYNYLTLHDGADLLLATCVKSKWQNRFQLVRNEKSRLKDAYKPRHINYEEDPFRIWYDSTGHMVRWNEPDLPDGYERADLLCSEQNPQWAAYQQKVRAWEATLAQKGLG